MCDFLNGNVRFYLLVIWNSSIENVESPSCYSPVQSSYFFNTGGRVERYRLRFFKVPSKGSGGPPKYSVIEKVDIPPNRFVVHLIHLEANQVYKAQIHAVVVIGEEHVLKGDKASLMLHTSGNRKSKGMQYLILQKDLYLLRGPSLSYHYPKIPTFFFSFWNQV